MGFDKRVFQQKGILLAAYHDVANLANLLHQHPHLRRMVLILNEIRAYTLAQRLGLTHIDNRSVAVQKLIHARVERQGCHLLTQYIFAVAHIANLHIFLFCHNNFVHSFVVRLGRHIIT